MKVARRGVLGWAASAAALGACAWAEPATAQQPGGAEREQPAIPLVATRRVLEVNGKPAPVFGLIGPRGRPGLDLAPGQHFRVDLTNRAGVPTIMHWHGQAPAWTQDGFPWPGIPPIGDGAVRHYDFRPAPGTYWMHSHFGLQEQQLMAAPLIVHEAADLAEDAAQVTLMLHDFSFRPPSEILHTLRSPMARMAGMSMAEGTASATEPDLNDVVYDAFLANDRTLADPDVVMVERRGRVRLRIINAAAASQFWITFAGQEGMVLAADGRPVQPLRARRIPIAVAQRFDVVLDLGDRQALPVLAQVEGTRHRTGIILATPHAAVGKIAGSAARPAPAVDLSLERRLRAARPLLRRAPDMRHPLALGGGMAPYEWRLNGAGWPHPKVLGVSHGQRVEITMANRTMMSHPIHLHGHGFQVVGIGGVALDGAVRDTVLAPARGEVRIAFDADNPGRWPLHCHNIYHMAAGMMTELRYPGFCAGRFCADPERGA